MSLHVMVLSRRRAQQYLSVSCNTDVPVFVIWILKAARPCINIQYHSSLCARLQISGNPNTTCHKCKQQWHIQSPSQKSSFHKRDHISLSYSFHSHSDQLKNWVEKQLMKFSKVKPKPASGEEQRCAPVHTRASLAGKQKWTPGGSWTPMAKQASGILGWSRGSISAGQERRSFSFDQHWWGTPECFLDSPIEGRYGHTEISATKSHECDEGTGASLRRKGWQSWTTA